MMYCFVGDVIGFRNIILNLSPEEQSRRVSEWGGLVESAATQHCVSQLRVFSDTVFAGTPDSEEGLRALLAFAKTLLETGISRAFPLRGGIAFGDAVWGERVTFGPAIVKSYELGDMQQWIGVSCDVKLPRLDLMWDFDTVVCYPAPMKAGPVFVRGVVPWRIPSLEELVRHVSREGLTREGQVMQWDWAAKLENTITFSLYLSLARAHGDPRHFYGRLPIQAIEMEMKKLACNDTAT